MRIGVNIPDDLRARLKPLMTVSNISQICRDAIRAYVENFERAQEKAKRDGMEGVADRFALEMMPKYVDWASLGLEDAKLCINSATIDDFERLVERLEYFHGKEMSNWETIVRPISGTRCFYEREQEHKEWLSWLDKVGDEYSSIYFAAKAEYQQAFLNYILAVWQMVEDKIAADATEIMKRFKEAGAKSLEEGLREGKAKAEILAKQ